MSTGTRSTTPISTPPAPHTTIVAPISDVWGPGETCGAGPETEGCITCGDVAKRVRVTALDPATWLAVCVDEHGISSEVDIYLAGNVPIGTEVMVHAGTVIAVAPTAGADTAEAPITAGAPTPTSPPAPTGDGVASRNASPEEAR